MTARSTALVTGANRGIGNEIARQLARFGMRSNTIGPLMLAQA